MNKLPLIRQGQGFDYTVLNTIIKTINELIIDQPGYDTMMNDMATINNQYTSKIDSFIERYRDVVDNTPDLLELLKAYAALKEKCDGTPKISYEISSLALDFVKNPEKDNGYFDLLDTGLPNITPGFSIPKGKAIVCVDSTGDTSVFIQCTDIEFNQSAAYSWLCLDTIVGAEGPAGPQGKEGPQGIPGQDGEDGVIVNIRGNLNQVEGENIQLKLDSLINNPSINLQPDDAFIWEEESDPKIFVYTPNEQFSDPAYPGWTLIRSIRGPQGPKGEGTKLKIGFASSSASDAPVTPSENVTLDNINEFFFLCIAIAEPNQPLVYNTRIRIRQGNQEFLPEVNWKYINESGAAVSYKEQDNDGKPISLKLIPVANTDTTEQQTLQLNLKDISDITAVKILEGGKLELTKEYQHIPTNVPGVDKPKIQKLIAEGTVSDFIKIDNTLTDEGTNAVQGKIVKKYIDNEANNIKIKMREKADLRDGKILASQLPGSVGKIIEGTLNSTIRFTATDGAIYGPKAEGVIVPEPGSTFLDGNKSYGWSGSKFVQISASITIGTTAGTAYDGKAGQDNANAIQNLNTEISNIKEGTTPVPNATTSSSCTGNSATATTADKVSNGLTISLNGSAQSSFNGSSPVAFDITPSTIGALPANGKAKNSDKADIAGSCSGNALTSTNATNHIANTSNPHSVTKAQVGLGNVANERQYSAQNPPPYPVTTTTLKDYATKTELTNGLNGKQPTGDYAYKNDLENYVGKESLYFSLKTSKPYRCSLKPGSRQYIDVTNFYENEYDKRDTNDQLLGVIFTIFNSNSRYILTSGMFLQQQADIYSDPTNNISFFNSKEKTYKTYTITFSKEGMFIQDKSSFRILDLVDTLGIEQPSAKLRAIYSDYKLY